MTPSGTYGAKVLGLIPDVLGPAPSGAAAGDERTPPEGVPAASERAEGKAEG